MIVEMKNNSLVGRFKDNNGIMQSNEGNFDFDNVEREK